MRRKRTPIFLIGVRGPVRKIEGTLPCGVFQKLDGVDRARGL